MSATTQNKPSTRLTATDGNKRIVHEFYDLAFNQRQPGEAANKYLGKRYVQHNPGIGDGADAFVIGITGWLATMPGLQVDFKRFVAEGDLVVVHSHFVPAPGQRGMAVMDIFRLENGKIVEHWDTLQDVPVSSSNSNTMF